MKKDTRLTRFTTRALVAGCFSMGMAVASAEETTTVVTTGDDTVTDTVVETSTIGRSTNVESKLTSEFSDFLGGDENAASVVEGLRTGKAFELDDVEHHEDNGDTTTTGAVTTADTGTQTSGADTAPETPTELPTGTMGYGNVRLTLRLAQAELANAGITQPNNEQLSAMLLGGEIDGVQYEGILNERAAGAGWGEIAQRYDFKVGQLMGKAPAAKPVVDPVAEPAVQDTTTTATRSNGYIPSGKTKFTYTGDKSGHRAPKAHGAKRNGYIPSGSATQSTATNQGNGNLKVKGSGARKNGYIPSGSANGSGGGIVSAQGGAARVKTNHGQSKGQMKGYIPSGSGGQSAGIVSATNASATAAVSAAGGQGHGKGHAKGRGKSK